MRQVSIEEAGAVSGAACEDLTVSLSIAGLSVTGSAGDWMSCFSHAGDILGGYLAHYTTGIPYGQPHVG